MLLLTAVAFVTVLMLAMLSLAETLRAGEGKIIAALKGRSMVAAASIAPRPVTVRVTSRRVSQPVSATPRMRAAA